MYMITSLTIASRGGSLTDPLRGTAGYPHRRGVFWRGCCGLHVHSTGQAGYILSRLR
jgi:hypothetical protein